MTAVLRHLVFGIWHVLTVNDLRAIGLSLLVVMVNVSRLQDS